MSFWAKLAIALAVVSKLASGGARLVFRNFTSALRTLLCGLFVGRINPKLLSFKQTNSPEFSGRVKGAMSSFPSPLRPVLLVGLIGALAYHGFTIGACAAEGPTVGLVTQVANQAQVGTETAAVGTLVHMNDKLLTGAKGRLQVTFRDKTELTLGENASVVVDHYVFNPDAGLGEATLNVTKGAFRFATGLLKDMPKKNITVSTPVAALAVRGTDFWSGFIDGAYGVVLFDESKLSVKNEIGAVMLTSAGMGTDIPAPLKDTQAPGRPYKWPPDKIARALAQTNIGLTINPGIIGPLVPLVPVIPGILPSPNPPPRSP